MKAGKNTVEMIDAGKDKPASSVSVLIETQRGDFEIGYFQHRNEQWYADDGDPLNEVALWGYLS
ncbi:MAG: hypothetical protein IBX56_12405 [Methylomicrobium sp.]|nr:hypothetical protein [Methylomicrobium sp.]